VNKELSILNKELFEAKLRRSGLANVSSKMLEYPEKVVQIGEGNFLRAFVDWMFHEMNKKGIFGGRVVVVQPIQEGRVKYLNEQDGLYTLLLRGMQEGKVVNEKEVITSISRGLEAYTQWKEVLELAENPEIEFVVSNTTEAGIAYVPSNKLSDNPPDSYPGKLTAFLYHRFQYFKGAMDKGMVIIPVELIDRNGDNLKKIVIQLAGDWELPQDFIEWIEKANHFLNTLVDRIVTGYPHNEARQIEEELGYCDSSLVAGEIFHLWVIEGDKKLKERLPFHKIGLNVKWVDDLTLYRTRKVRILNGAHTSSVAVAYLAGIDIVRDAVNDTLVEDFMRAAIFDDIIPTLDLGENELKEFADAVLERFKNPFIDHKWLDISLNSISKFKTRVLPSLVEYGRRFGTFPKMLTFAFAALIAFYRGSEIKDGKLVAYRNGEEYFVNDDMEALEFFRELWASYENNKIDLKDMVKAVLSKVELWDGNLSELPGLADRVYDYLNSIVTCGMRESLIQLLA
jgi:tagaturonate reductase